MIEWCVDEAGEREKEVAGWEIRPCVRDLRKCCKRWSATFLAAGTDFVEEFFPQTQGVGGFGMVQACYSYCALYYYYISSTSDHQALDPGVGCNL